MGERKSCLDCVFCKKITADGIGLAAVECTRDGSWPYYWQWHQCSFYQKKEGK